MEWGGGTRLLATLLSTDLLSTALGLLSTVLGLAEAADLGIPGCVDLVGVAGWAGTTGLAGALVTLLCALTTGGFSSALGPPAETHKNAHIKRQGIWYTCNYLTYCIIVDFSHA